MDDVQRTASSSRAGVVFAGSVIVLVFILFLSFGFHSLFKNSQQLEGALSRIPRQEKRGVNPNAAIESDFAYYVGPAQARVTVVEFLDFQCPYCKIAHSTMKELMAHYRGQSVKFVFRHFPIEGIHPVALDAARASMCAKEQNKFMEIHNLFYEKQDQITQESLSQFAKDAGVGDINRFNVCLTSRRYDSIIRKDQNDGADLGIEGTPTFFVNKEKIEGAVASEVFIEAIDRALR